MVSVLPQCIIKITNARDIIEQLNGYKYTLELNGYTDHTLLELVDEFVLHNAMIHLDNKEVVFKDTSTTYTTFSLGLHEFTLIVSIPDHT